MIRGLIMSALMVRLLAVRLKSTALFIWDYLKQKRANIRNYTKQKINLLLGNCISSGQNKMLI
jgi:hypothetical protein